LIGDVTDLFCRHEGRTWYTQHRGTLWIAATAKTPTKDEIEHVENQYRQYYNGNCLFGS